MRTTIVLSIVAMSLCGCGAYDPSTSYELAAQGQGDQPGVVTSLEGCWIVAQDGQPLGLITKNQFRSDAITNEFGKYGSKFSVTSIFNEFGRYGGEFSLLSPFNKFSAKPPLIVTPSGDFVAYLTKNSSKTPAVAPDALIALFRSDSTAPSSTGLQPNAYGLGVHSNRFGQPVTIRPDFGGVQGEQLQLRENAYGPGVHADQYGRPVREYSWPDGRPLP